MVRGPLLQVLVLRYLGARLPRRYSKGCCTARARSYPGPGECAEGANHALSASSLASRALYSSLKPPLEFGFGILAKFVCVETLSVVALAAVLTAATGRAIGGHNPTV